MQRSTERILTTHTGSLPRPDALRTLLIAKKVGEPYDQEALPTRIATAVAESVHKQQAIGLDVINDGEMSKFLYATYVKDRLTGFEGESTPPQVADLQDYPAYAQRLLGQPSRRRKTPACTGPVALKDPEAVHRDMANFRAALHGVHPADTFMTAASPGVIALFMQNQHYPSHEAYLYALADAMKREYNAIAHAGFLLQVDCPDLAAGRHTQFAHLTLEAFRRQVALHIAVLNYALADIPPDRLRLHLCWGNYEGPHHRDVPLRDILDLVLQARPAALSFEAANPRHAHEWSVFQEIPLSQDKVVIPGVVDSTTNFIEHPALIAERIMRFATVVGRERVMAGTDCGLATSAAADQVDPGIAWAKLQALVEGAQLASQQLW
jgi:5-methyltetrahydropteroyltriglutamate--homocysteine methyltransferase